MNMAVGNSKAIGNYVNKALYNPIVNPTITPTHIPIRLLENTKV